MRRRTWEKGVLWLALGVVCWCCAVSALATRDSLWNTKRLSYRQPSASTTAENIVTLRHEIAEADGGSVAAWGQAVSQTVSSTEMNGSAAVDVLWIEGDASLVWNLPVLRGSLPGQGDAEGCALDEATALKLFGSLDAVGRAVTVGSAELVVRGVFAPVTGVSALGVDPGRGLALCAAASAPEGFALTAMEFLVKSEEAKPAAEQVQAWMRSAGLSTNGTLDDHQDQRTLLTVLTSLPAYLLALFALLELLSGALALSGDGAAAWKALRLDRLAPARRKGRLALTWAAGFLLVAGAAWLTFSLVPQLRSVPPSYLPTQWSDFAFWPDRITADLQADAQHAMTVALRPDMVFDRLRDWCVGLLLAAIGCVWHGRNTLRAGAHEVRPLPACLMGVPVCAAVPLALWIADRAGWAPSAPQGLLLLPLLLYVLIAALRVWKVFRGWFRAFHKVLPAQNGKE